MPILSTKPPRGDFSPGTKETPTPQHFQRGQRQLERLLPTARREVNRHNRQILALTQPYRRAAALRAGNQFQLQQEAAIRTERVGAAPYRGFGSVADGKRRRLPDVGP